MHELIFDEQALEDTATAIQCLNPHAANYKTAALVEHMKATARRAFSDGSDGYIRTLGFVLTVFANPEGKREIFSSVDTYTVNQYIRRRNG